MEFLRQYKLLVLGGVFLLLAIVVGGGVGRKKETAQATPSASLARPASAVQADEPAQPSPQHRRTSDREPPPKEEETPEETSSGADSSAGTDSTTVEEECDPDAARGEALSKVQSFESQLAATLRTINPNARKVRLKALELTRKADDLDEWIREQDKAGGTDCERREWKAQRSVWVSHSKDLRMIAKRLTATHGTKRKVRILAKEIAEKAGS